MSALKASRGTWWVTRGMESVSTHVPFDETVEVTGQMVVVV